MCDLNFLVIDFWDNAFDKGKQERVQFTLFSACLHHSKYIKNSWVPKGGFQPPDSSTEVTLALKVEDTRSSHRNWTDCSPHRYAYHGEFKFSQHLAEPNL